MNRQEYRADRPRRPARHVTQAMKNAKPIIDALHTELGVSYAAIAALTQIRWESVKRIHQGKCYPRNKVADRLALLAWCAGLTDLD